MGISKCLSTGLKYMFNMPGHELRALNIGIGASSLAYSVYNLIKEGQKPFNNEAVDRRNLMKTVVGLSVFLGSGYGPGGALLLGGGMKLLTDSCKEYLKEDAEKSKK